VATSTWNDNYLTAGSHLYSTYLASTVDTYSSLADRITYSLGYPIVNLELHGHQIFTNITLAVELFTKFAGYTLEHLVVDSTKYTIGQGLDISKLFLLTPELTATYTDEVEVTISQQQSNPPTSAASFDADATRDDSGAPANAELARWIPLFEFDSEDAIIDPSDYTFVMTLDDGNASVEKAIVLCLSSVNTVAPGNPGISGVQVELTPYGSANTTANDMFTVSSVPSLPTEYWPQGGTAFTQKVSVGVVLAEAVTQGGQINGTRNITVNDSTVISQLTATSPSIGRWDGLTRQNRKVMEVFSYDESTSSSLNTLFTIEQTLAQQTYFSYAMGNYGFDLISWYILKQWLETREKMLSTKRYFKFNERNQHLLMIPEPKENERFYGVITCYVEKHIKDVIKEPWVYQYASALTKITLGRVRGKFGNAQLFGGTGLDTSILQEGLTEKKELEERLFTGASAGFGDSAPPMFFVG
jgi:hypothetical protein